MYRFNILETKIYFKKGVGTMKHYELKKNKKGNFVYDINKLKCVNNYKFINFE